MLTAANGIISGDDTGNGRTGFTPILADVVGNGKSQTVVSVGDGYVYVLGN
jgi:hypothetical protein